MNRVIYTLDRIVDVVGRAVSITVLLITAIIISGIVVRTVFSGSAPWSYDTARWLMTAYVFLGSGYAFRRKAFVRVDIIYLALPEKYQALIDVTLGTAMFVLFVGCLLTIGYDLALSSFEMNEVSATGTWNGPVYLAKAMVPAGALMLSLAWLSHVLQLWQTHLSRKD